MNIPFLSLEISFVFYFLLLFMALLRGKILLPIFSCSQSLDVFVCKSAQFCLSASVSIFPLLFTRVAIAMRNA